MGSGIRELVKKRVEKNTVLFYDNDKGREEVKQEELYYGNGKDRLK